MKASYTTRSGEYGKFSHPVILPQAMNHADGFMLLGFESWEAVTDEKMNAAVTDLVAFDIDKSQKMGFHNEDKS